MVTDFHFLKTIQFLEDKGVTISYVHDRYKTGINCNFQIRFANGKGTYQYGDNHEFGNIAQTMVASVKLATKMVTDEEFMYWYFAEYSDVSKHEEISCNDFYLKKRKKLEPINDYIFSLYCDEHKKYLNDEQ